ncbi:MAG: argininosuccinate lyase [Bifidobacterium sp.]|nr:argininosuccinate lyase [Bifidobacterium sp.]MCI1864555.1 argininosuccinate lyase [Bifidobacterium sp.]
MGQQASHADEHLALWGGRFASGPSPELARLSKSTQFDWRLADDDIAGSRAHARALGRAGLLGDDELRRMEDALDELQRQVDSHEFEPIEDDEDEATALERGLISIAGDDLGGKLRAGRSRNDQIATLIRLWLRRHARCIASQLLRLVDAIIVQSQRAGGCVMPGRTHMQHAQPVLLAHQLMAHAWPLLRDVDRLQDWDRRIDQSPYGSGALAGSTLGLDPRAVADELGFSSVTDNSIDGTSSRDLVAEFSFVAAMIGVDLSRFSEEIIIWNTQEFAFVRLDDAYSTGSSIMPQKKNPDIAELARGKAGRLIGDLTGLMATLKGLPTAYARDLQEDKEAVFDQVDTLEVLLPAFTGMVSTLSFDTQRMESQAPTGFALATDIAEWLVKSGVPFRHAHELSGACVKLAESRGQELWNLDDADFSRIFAGFIPQEKAPEVRSVLSTQGSVAARNGRGGTAPERVREQIRDARASVRRLEGFALSTSDGPAYRPPRHHTGGQEGTLRGRRESGVTA